MKLKGKKMGYRKISEQLKIGKTQEINCVYYQIS